MVLSVFLPPTSAPATFVVCRVREDKYAQSFMTLTQIVQISELESVSAARRTLCCVQLSFEPRANSGQQQFPDTVSLSLLTSFFFSLAGSSSSPNDNFFCPLFLQAEFLSTQSLGADVPSHATERRTWKHIHWPMTMEVQQRIRCVCFMAEN